MDSEELIDLLMFGVFATVAVYVIAYSCSGKKAQLKGTPDPQPTLAET
jgi:hypothetical protein